MTSPDLHFKIEQAQALRFAASPHIVFKLRVTNRTNQKVHSVVLKCQVQLDVSRRHYTPGEQQHLTDLFGEPERWGQTLHSMLWTNTSTIVPSFEETTVVDLQIPCTFDFNVAATKYFDAIADGEIPIGFYFSGTVFYATEQAPFQASPISWEQEASYAMPIRTWREMMDAYYPNSAWLCLGREAFDRLHAYKIQYGIPTFDQALMQVMERIERTGP
jgi:hypothetical protein